MENSEFTFTVPGSPRPWQRARRDGRSGRTFTDNKTTAAKRDVWVIGNAAMKSQGIKMAAKGVPVMVEVLAYFQLPAKISKKERDRRVARGFHTQKPDVDNIVKLIKDALNGTVWHDDCQVQIKGAEKYWISGPSRTVVTVEILGENYE